MNLSDIRDKLASILAPLDDEDPSVLASLVDTITPPALMIGWADPWLMPTGPCFQQGNIIVTAVAGRLVPGDGIATLEDLVTYTLSRVKADSEGNWSLVEVSGPRVFIMAKTNYLACRIGYHVTVDE